MSSVPALPCAPLSQYVVVVGAPYVLLSELLYRSSHLSRGRRLCEELHNSFWVEWIEASLGPTTSDIIRSKCLVVSIPEEREEVVF